VRSAPVDFLVTRSSGAPPYLLAVRPLVDKAGRADDSGAVAIVFVHDPPGRDTAAMRLFREVFGFTESEASLAQSLQQGVPIGHYARARSVSVNTLYTHLRGKEKTGCKRMPELIHKLNELRVPVRGG
jgi:DNA-binding CsgD family transcriptional regulator